MRWLSSLLNKLRRLGGPESRTEMVAEPKELSRDEFRALLEEQVADSFGMSLSEFTDALADGRIDPESPRVAGLAILVGARAR